MPSGRFLTQERGAHHTGCGNTEHVALPVTQMGHGHTICQHPQQIPASGGELPRGFQLLHGEGLPEDTTSGGNGAEMRARW